MIPKIRALASATTSGLWTAAAVPPLSSNMAPVTMVAVASVMIMGWMRNRLMEAPFSTPMSVVPRRRRGTESQPSSPTSRVRAGPSTAASVTTAPTERSTPAVMITTVWPAAAMPRIADSSNM